MKQELKMTMRFYESLCTTNEEVIKECFNLKKYGEIHEYYIRNDFVRII